MADNTHVEGLPEGATVGPSLQSQPQVEGLPEGATVGPPLKRMGGAGGDFGDYPAPESTAAKAWRKSNEALLPAGRAETEGKEYAESPTTLEESKHPLWTGMKKFGAGTYSDTAATARQMLTSPLGIALMGTSELGEVLPNKIKPAIEAAHKIAGLGFGAQGAEQAYQGASEMADKGVNAENLSKTAGGLGQAFLGGAGTLHDTKIGNEPATKALAAPVRAASALGKPLSHIIPSVGGIVVASEAGIPHPFIVGGTVGRFILPPETLERMFEKGRTLGLNDEEANIVHLRDRYNEAVKDAKQPEREYKAHEAGRQQGIPAPDDVLRAHEKAQKNLQESESHLKAAEADYAARLQAKAAPAGAPQPEITPEAVAAARPEAPTPTKEENDAKLRGLMEKIAPTEKPAPIPENVKQPGQVQPETFPQEPKPLPRAESPLGTVPLAGPEGERGVMLGKQRLLGAGEPEAAPAVPEAPKTPLGEILPPEKPAKPGRLGTLKVAEGGKVVDTEPQLQQKIEEGLQGKAKPVAVPPVTRAFEEVLPKHEEIKEEATEPKKFEEVLPKHEELTEPHEKELANEGLTPEDSSKVEQVLSQHSDQDLLRIARKNGIDTDKYDLAKRDENRHRVDRDQLVKDTLAALPEADKTNIARLSDEFNKKDTTLWTEAERSNLSKAQRARAIMQEHEGGAKAVAGGAPDEHRDAVEKGGGEYKGVQEGVPSANLKGLVLFDHPETHSTLALPEDEVTPEAVKAKLDAHKAEWDAKSKPEHSQDLRDFSKEFTGKELDTKKVPKDARGSDIADAYDKMKHDPSDPKVKASYDALTKETQAQWDALKNKGYTMSTSPDNPYATAKEMMDDIRNNKHITVWEGGQLPEDHPMSKTAPGTDVSNNTLFRAVHDILGHAKEGNDFSEKGEENAFQQHSQMYSKEAQPALATETKGQASWVFNHEGVRTGSSMPGDMFPEQKAAILPEEFHAKTTGASTNDVLEHIKADKPFAVLTAENPLNERATDAENSRANAKLMDDLKAKGYKPIAVEGFNKDVKGNTEHSIFVPDITAKEAADLGRKYKQASILTHEGLHDLDKNTINPSDNKGLLTGAEAKKQPYYSVVNGEPFSVPLDFDKEVTSKDTTLSPQSSEAAAGKTYRPTHASGEWTEYPNAPEGVHKPGEAESDIEMARRGADVPEKAKAYKDMTPEEQEALAAKGQSGASGKKEELPTGDALIKKYGEASGDPAHTAFILPDGRGVAQPGGAIHDEMLGGKATDVPAPREHFLDSGGIRVRYRQGGIGGRETSISLPKDGITEEQLEYLKKMAPQMGSGTVMLETNKGGRPAVQIDYGKASEQLESKLRDLVPIKKEENGLPPLAEQHLTPEEKEGIKVTPLSERPNKTILTVKVDGERAGQMSLTPAPELGKDAMEISTSQLGEAFRGKGHGTEMYRKVIAYAKDKGIKTIYSDDAVSTKADNVWQSLVRKGEAKWDSSVKRYKVTISPLGKIKS
jgi:predicted GNAT family acetyltransferase